MEDFGGLDFAISAAGYNSFHELLHAGVPTAFFAQEKIADEQSRRVRAAVEAGCALALDVGGHTSFYRDDLTRVVTLMRDPDYRAALAEKAREFVPTNDARDAAFEALATILPGDVLEEALELGTPGFFPEMARHGVELELVERALKYFKAVDELDADERRELILRLISDAGANGRMSIRSFEAFAQHFPAPVKQIGAEELVQGALRVIRAATPFEDERATLELLRRLPRGGHAEPSELAAALCNFLNALHANGETIWRGQAVLARQLEATSSDDSPVVALGAAAAEIRLQGPIGADAVETGHGHASRESYDSTYAD
jgi:hypothetical protein